MSFIKNKYQIVFLPSDGEYTILTLSNLYKRIMCNNIYQNLFYDRPITESRFISLLTDEECTPYVVCKNGVIVLLCWLNSWKGNSARLHFTMFPESWGTARNAFKIGTKMVRYLLSAQLNGSHFVDTIIGVTPMTNKLACRYALNVGMKKIAIIPNSDYNFYSGKTEDMMLSIATREIMGMTEKDAEPRTWEW